MELTGRQRRHLRALAHHKDPVVFVGKAGLTDAVHDKVDEELEIHELIKVKVLQEAPTDVKEAGAVLAERAGAHLAQTVGHIALLYRRRKDKPAIRLPE
jgi:RNA-binding protein